MPEGRPSKVVVTSGTKGIHTGPPTLPFTHKAACQPYRRLGVLRVGFGGQHQAHLHFRSGNRASVLEEEPLFQPRCPPQIPRRFAVLACRLYAYRNQAATNSAKPLTASQKEQRKPHCQTQPECLYAVSDSQQIGQSRTIPRTQEHRREQT